MGLELCRALGIDFVSVTEAVDTSVPAGEMLFQMIGAVAPVRAVSDRRTGSGRYRQCPEERHDFRTTFIADLEIER